MPRAARPSLRDLCLPPDLCVHRGYAPERNPVEGIWCNGKARELRGYCGDVEEDVEDRVDRSLRRQSRQRHILLGHVRQTGLRLPALT